MINTFFTILILVFAAFFAIGTTVMIAQEKRKEQAGKFDMQGTVKYTRGDNT
tara:strand:+ start:188 stop:343 length:156 start_codon:yes stop_codon:yes gene_type:complete